MIIRKFISFRQNAFSKITSLRERIRLPEKWKGGRVERWCLFWEGLVLDYKGVANDVIQGAHNKPVKALFVTSGLSIALTAVKTNPDEQSFHDRLTHCLTNLSMVGDPIRNPSSEKHIQYLTRCQNQGLLRKTDLLFFTLMWTADYSKECDVYAAQCKYLKPRYVTFYERIVDVGMFGTWWNLKFKMRDFDINPNEWPEST